MANDDTEAEKRTSYQHATDEVPWPPILATFGFFALLVYGVLAKGWFTMEIGSQFIRPGHSMDRLGTQEADRHLPA
ncbi:hypothetical protein [Halomonas caseinilytica]|uniref:hypothetical protein n=1 Tax=Halomonas caseinilytica TaxID=438744 RepID=UPI0008492334|nr:hypothetical protein [Halomonas caseinilytica]